MTNYAVPTEIVYPTRRLNTPASSLPPSVSTLDAINEYVCQVFRIPVTGTVIGAEWRTVTVTTGSTMTVQLETVSATTGDPTGTLYHANATGTCVIASTDDTTWINDGFGGGAAWGSFSVTKGDLAAFLVKQPGVSAGNLQVGGWPAVDTVNIPYLVTNTSGSAVKSVTNSMIFALEYNGGVYYPIEGGFIMPAARTSTGWNNGSADKEYGAKIPVPFDGRSSGVLAVLDFDADNDIIISLYNSGGTEIAVTPTIDCNQLFAYGGANGDIMSTFFWTTPVDLTGGSTYYVGIKPQGANTMEMQSWTPQGSAQMGAMPGGGNIVRVRRATQGSGAWTETTTDEPTISLLFDQLGRAGGGIITHPGMSGGMRG